MPETTPASAPDTNSMSRRRWTIRFRKRAETPVDWKRLFFILLGISLFLTVYLSPPWPDAIDPMGEAFELSSQGKAALGLDADCLPVAPIIVGHPEFAVAPVERDKPQIRWIG